MARPKLPLGAWGTVNISHVGRSKYKARARFRDTAGVTRPVARFGQTKDEARRRLLEALVAEQDIARTSTVRNDLTVAQLAALWLERAHDWSSNTRETYEGVVARQVRPELGSVRLIELRPSVVNAALERVMSKSGNGAAKTTRTVLAGMFDLAVAHDAIRQNPARGTIRISQKPSAAVRALTVAETEDLTDRLRTDQRALDLDLPDLVDWMLGTGCRIGEACAARQRVLDLTVGTWEINATLIRVKGSGLVIQGRPKTAAGWRVLALPPYVLAMLQRRASELRFRAEGVLFASPRANRLRDPSNTSGDLREVLDRLGYGWVHSHTFRKTVATRLDEAGMSARVIADQLGHRKPSMTQDVYMGRNVVSAAAAKVLDR